MELTVNNAIIKRANPVFCVIITIVVELSGPDVGSR
jgi:hypothetical protein